MVNDGKLGATQFARGEVEEVSACVLVQVQTQGAEVNNGGRFDWQSRTMVLAVFSV
jgi:hypothetical protein